MLPIEICVEERKKMDIGTPIKGHLRAFALIVSAHPYCARNS